MKIKSKIRIKIKKGTLEYATRWAGIWRRANELDLAADWEQVGRQMGVPNTPATLTAEQLAELNKKLGHMRHEINNQLAMVVAALEMIRFRPETRDKMLATISQQPPMIMAEVAKFSAEFEQAFGATRG